MTIKTAQGLTQQAAEFAAGLEYEDIPKEALRIARRCIIDGLGVMLAGSQQPAIDVAERYARLNR